MERPGNIGQHSCLAMISRTRRATLGWVMCFAGPPSIRLSPRPGSLHVLSPAWPTLLTHVVCSRFLSPLLSGTHHRGDVFWTRPWRTDTALLKWFYFTKRSPQWALCPFSDTAHSVCLSAGQHDVPAICALESRQLEFPFSLSHLPEKLI